MRKISNDLKLTILMKARKDGVSRGSCICNSIYQAVHSMDVCNDLDFNLPDHFPGLYAIKPFIKGEYSYWFGDLYCATNTATRLKKIDRLIRLYSRNIQLEMFLWKIVGKIKRIIIK